jgi:protein ImuB
MKERLWLALRLVDLPLMSFPAHPAEQAVCVLEKRRVVCTNLAALNAGVHTDMDATTAQLLSNCITYQRDIAQEQSYLDQLAEHLYVFTPYIQIFRSEILPDSGLLLELSRCLKLFNGLKNLCDKIFSTLADISIATGLAHTEEGAWLLSYEHHAISGDEDRSIFIERLNRVPIGRLYDWPQAAEALKRMGFHYLGDISRQIETQSISSIKKRFDRGFINFITRVFAIEQSFQQTALFTKPIQVYQQKEFFFDTLQFDYPITQVDQLHIPLENMLQNLGEFLRNRKLACQQIEWRLLDIHQNSHCIHAHCATPQNTWKLFYQLSLIQLDNRQLPFAVDAIELTCHNLQKWQEENHSLNFSGARSKNSGSHDLALLEGKLRARLGGQAIFKISYKDSHIPEQTCERLSVFANTNQQLPPPHLHATRPTWFFETPLPAKRQEALFWRGTLELLTGPERIEGQWWTSPIARDYYVARREDGLRVWVYRDLSNDNWFVQGIFAGNH